MDLHTLKVGVAIAAGVVIGAWFLYAMYLGEGAIKRARKEDRTDN